MQTPGHLGSRDDQQVLSTLNSPDPNARCDAIEKLANRGSDDALNAVIPMLSSSHEQVQDCAEQLLDKPSVVARLLVIWETAPEKEKIDILGHIAQLNNELLFDLYSKASTHPNMAIRSRVAFGLQNQETHKLQAIQLLAKLANDREPSVRRAAYRSLAVLDGPVARKIINQQINNEDNRSNRRMLKDIRSSFEDD